MLCKHRILHRNQTELKTVCMPASLYKHRILHRNQTMVMLNDQIIEARSLATCYLVVHNCYLRENKQGRGVTQKHYL